ncbi:hypothetical protein TA3x_005663 [Tundrisphaera sp. TA3]|uniref:hypothetical protein n=1 Tax=Tundrisphaera sp. TA3 TaxID=3435775 RepID=UPI003EBA0B9B
MRLRKSTVLALGFCLSAAGLSSAQDTKGESTGPKQYVVHEGFVWKAWATKGPQGVLHVSGVLNKKGGPGEYADLKPASPQGINPKILILEVKLGQLPGEWPEPLVDLPTVYEQAKYTGDYESISVRFSDGKEIHFRVNPGGGGS